MNVWAHMVLGLPDPEHQVGQFLGDFCKGPVESLPYSAGIRWGIRGHRKVDAVGDSHEFTRITKSFLLPEERRYGGLVLDLLCDWLLHENWEVICVEEKRDVIRTCERCLSGDRHQWPAGAQGLAGLVLDHQLFDAVGHLSEIRYAVGRMGKRLRRPRDLQPILERLIQQERWLHEHFPAYFQDMRQCVEELV